MSFCGSASARGLDDARADGQRQYCDRSVGDESIIGMALTRAQQIPEFDILCSALRANPDLDQIADALNRDVDWGDLLSLAAAHAVRPRLIHAFQKLNWIGMPAGIKESLIDFLKLHTAHSLFIAAELIRVTDELSQRAIPFATFKGPSLAAGLYGDLSCREYEDVDLIVEEQQIAKTEAVLGLLGYRAALGSSVFRNAFLAYQRQFAFVRENPSLTVDLHWGFNASYVPFPISQVEIWSNLEEVNIGGRRVPTLGREDLALFLVGHGTKEGWRRLGWVGDFAMFIEKNSDLDWDHLLARAQQRRCGRSLLLGCQLAAELLGSRTKFDLNKVAENTGQPLLTVQTVLRRLRSGIPPHGLNRNLGDLELCENWLQKARAVGMLLITRTVGDYTSMPLPRLLWRVYHVTRPFRLAGNAIANFGSKGSGQRGRELPSRSPEL
jgi:hypothetical protein